MLAGSVSRFRSYLKRISKLRSRIVSTNFSPNAEVNSVSSLYNPMNAISGPKSASPHSPRRVTGGVVKVAASGTRLRVAAGPRRDIHGVDGRRFASGERMVGEQISQGLGVEPSTAQCIVEAAPAAAVGRFETQVDRRRYRLRGEDSVGDLEEGVGAAWRPIHSFCFLYALLRRFHRRETSDFGDARPSLSGRWASRRVRVLPLRPPRAVPRRSAARARDRGARSWRARRWRG